MENKKYKIVNLNNKEVIYVDFIIDNYAILEYKVNKKSIDIIEFLDVSNEKEFKILESTNMIDSTGKVIYNEDTVEVLITVDYRPQGVIAIKNGTAIIKYKEKVFQKTEEPLYSVIGEIKVI